MFSFLQSLVSTGIICSFRVEQFSFKVSGRRHFCKGSLKFFSTPAIVIGFFRLPIPHNVVVGELYFFRLLCIASKVSNLFAFFFFQIYLLLIIKKQGLKFCFISFSFFILWQLFLPYYCSFLIVFICLFVASPFLSLFTFLYCSNVEVY